MASVSPLSQSPEMSARPSSRTSDRDLALANALPEIIWTCDAQGRLDWVNDRWYEFTGLTEAETYDKGALRAVHPDDRAVLERHWTRALETSSPTQFEYRIRAASGEYRWHFARVSPVRDDNGTITRWVAAVLDVQDQRAGDESRRAAHSFFYLSPIPIFVTRQSDGVFLFVNDAFVALLGYPRDEVLGRSTVELGLLTRESRAESASYFGGHTGRSREQELRTKDGRLLNVMISNAHIEVDRVPCFLSMATDLTERRKLEDALRRADQQKDEFLALLSHELRNPLTPILTAARILERRVDDESRRDVDVVVRQVKHLARLVDDLLDLARVARGAITLSKGRLEVATVITHAVEATGPLFRDRRHRLLIDVPDEGLAVDADEVRLTQIFDNLLTNAARYTPEGGTIRVTGCREGGEVVVRIHDTGRGIEPELLPQLFDAFAQGPRGLDRAGGGLGLGLSLVRMLTELHGGTVTAHSDGAGMGSELTVRLPAAAADSNAKKTTPPRAGPLAELRAPGTATRVLVVDDQRDVADSLARLLELLGYDVRAELDPVAALATAESFRPHAALVDIGLPTMNGYALAEQLRTRLGASAPVLIALSGYAQQQDRRHSRAAGFATHLAKPVDLDELVQALEKAVPS